MEDINGVPLKAGNYAQGAVTGDLYLIEQVDDENYAYTIGHCERVPVNIKALALIRRFAEDFCIYHPDFKYWHPGSNYCSSSMGAFPEDTKFI
jgi:hypothetical protein